MKKESKLLKQLKTPKTLMKDEHKKLMKTMKEEPFTYPHKGEMWHRASANVEDLPRLSFVSFDPSRDIARWRMRKNHIT